MGKLLRNKLNEWLRRYLAAEVLGTFVAAVMALAAYRQSHSYLAAAAAGFAGEGIGFYGYFIVGELRAHSLASKGLTLSRRIKHVISRSSMNLLVEFAPAGLICGLVVLPLALYTVPQFVKPYALGFVLGKLLSDFIFYSLAIAGYEVRQWRRRKRQFTTAENAD